jgi:hypothetical protein
MDTSASGNAYFVGRIGAAKVAMFLDKWAEGDTPVWELFVQDGDRPARRLRMPGRWPTAPRIPTKRSNAPTRVLAAVATLMEHAHPPPVGRPVGATSCARRPTGRPRWAVIP